MRNLPLLNEQMDELSAHLLYRSVLQITPNKVSIDTELAKDILNPSILADAFRGAASNSHREYLDSYLAMLNQISAPIIATPVQGGADKKRVMSFSNLDKSATANLANRVAWEALYQSFNASGAPCEKLTLEDNNPYPFLWPRDPCFIVEKVAFFPDPKLMGKYRGVTAPHMLEEYQKTWEHSHQMMGAQGLKVVTVEGCYFEGGNLVPDDVGGFLFYGQRFEHREEDMSLLCKAVERETGQSWKPVSIPTDPMQFAHLDLGMSPKLPNGKFLVSRSLGPDRNCMGYFEVAKHIGADRIITLDPRAEVYSAAIPNLVVMGNGLMMPYCPDDLRQTFTEQGMIVNAPTQEDLAGSIYGFSGKRSVRIIGQGGPHCQTNEYSNLDPKIS